MVQEWVSRLVVSIHVRHNFVNRFTQQSKRTLLYAILRVIEAIKSPFSDWANTALEATLSYPIHYAVIITESRSLKII